MTSVSLQLAMSYVVQFQNFIYKFRKLLTKFNFKGACNAVAVSHLIEAGKTQKYDFVTLAGDQAYNMEDFDGTKGDEYLNFMQDLFARVPYMGAVGNHEGAYNFSHYKNRYYAYNNDFINS